MSRTVLTNGRVYTLDESFRRVRTVVVEENKIKGTSKELVRKQDGKSLYLDLRNKTVIPAFCDSHVHLWLYAQSFDQVDLTTTKSLTGVLKLTQVKAKQKSSKGWILGRGWDINQWSNREHPDKNSLDKVFPDRPVALSSKDEHVLWVNSVALRLADIDEKHPDPAGGQIARYPGSREPTGILKEEACSLVRRLLDKPKKAESIEMLHRVAEEAHKLGITSVHDFDGAQTHHFLRESSEEGKLGLRTLEFFKREKLNDLINRGMSSRMGNEYLKIGGVKFFADGSLGSCTALLFEPYEGKQGNFGIEVCDVGELKSSVARVNALGLDVAVHAIGDRGVSNALDAMEYSLRRNGRHCANRIEHAQLVRPSDLKRFRDTGTAASIQPIHATSDQNIALKHWGRRCANSYLLKTFLKNKIKITFGSDCPIEELSPLKGIHAAVTRRREGKGQSPFYAKEKIGIKEAVLGFTKWPAVASGEERFKGSIEPGKLADMIVLSDDIFEVPPQKIPNIEILATIFDGKIVYGEENL